jgi:hypothetical protein
MFSGPGGLLAAPTPGPTLSAALAADADAFTWAAAVVGSNNAAGYQLASGVPVMALGGFNGTDPAPTLDGFKDLLAGKQIHYFIRGHTMIGHQGRATGGNTAGSEGGSEESSRIAEWVENHFRPMTVDGVVIYDLTTAAPNS